MPDSEHGTSTHEVASRTASATANSPPSRSHEDVASTAESIGKDRRESEGHVATEGKPHQIKPDGR